MKQATMKAKEVKKAIIFFGPPGSGKGTQAEKLAEKLGYVQFDSGHYIEERIRSKKYKDDPVVQKQKKLFLSGLLCEPWWVAELTEEHLEKFAKRSQGVILSGAFRDPREVFGEGKNVKEGVLHALERLYGKENIMVFLLELPVEESVKRNSKRGRPGLDEPKIIRIRCREYKKTTYPTIKRLKEVGVKIIKINGNQARDKVAKEVLKNFLAIDKAGLKKSVK